jgi:hypothetical protein
MINRAAASRVVAEHDLCRMAAIDDVAECYEFDLLDYRAGENLLHKVITADISDLIRRIAATRIFKRRSDDSQ